MSDRSVRIFTSDNAAMILVQCRTGEDIEHIVVCGSESRAQEIASEWVEHGRITK